jgi:hypothetical protein
MAYVAIISARRVVGGIIDACVCVCIIIFYDFGI